MKIAISQWQGRISPVFDVAQRALLIDLPDDRDRHPHSEMGREQVLFTSRTPFERCRELLRIDAYTLICGAVSLLLETELSHAGIRVIGFICGDVEAVIEAFKTNRLNDPALHMPGRMKMNRQAWPNQPTHGMRRSVFPNNRHKRQ
ncbi:MAG: hypothetical protein HKP58_08750 [Desulfatitalea sp.]|nr:hypothetical protein [Desulfatitalea sp.]NNK00487.1 hypothetical protein [Desulfatitalea sp.]